MTVGKFTLSSESSDRRKIPPDRRKIRTLGKFSDDHNFPTVIIFRRSGEIFRRSLFYFPTKKAEIFRRSLFSDEIAWFQTILVFLYGLGCTRDLLLEVSREGPSESPNSVHRSGWGAWGRGGPSPGNSVPFSLFCSPPFFCRETSVPDIKAQHNFPTAIIFRRSGEIFRRS